MNVDVAVFVLVARVTGVEPAVADRLGGFFGHVPIALHHLLRTNDDLADFAGGHFFALLVDDLQFDAHRRLAARTQQVLLRAVDVVVFVHQHGDHAGRLGEAVHLHEVALERLQRRSEHLLGDRRRAISDELQAREVGLVDVGHHQRERQQGRNHEGVRDAMLTDQLDETADVGGFANDDRLASVVLTRGGPATAADVEERHRDEVDRVLVHRPQISRRGENAHEVFVREHHAFRAARRAARVQLERDVAFLGVRTRVDWLVSRHPRLVRLVRRVTADDDDLLRVRQVAGDRVEHGHEVGADDEHFRARVVDDVRDFRRSKSEVDVDAHCVEQRAAVEHLEVLDRVLVEERDAVLAADPGRFQRLRNLRRALVELLPGLHTVALHERHLAGEILGVSADDSGDRRDRWCRRLLGYCLARRLLLRDLLLCGFARRLLLGGLLLCGFARRLLLGGFLLCRLALLGRLLLSCLLLGLLRSFTTLGCHAQTR